MNEEGEKREKHKRDGEKKRGGERGRERGTGEKEKHVKNTDIIDMRSNI